MKPTTEPHNSTQERLNPIPFLLSRAKSLYLRLESWVLDAKHASYGVSAARILYGLITVLFVATNFEYRNILWGSGAGWARPLLWDSIWGPPFTFYSSDDSSALFTAKYLLLGLAGLSLMVGFFSRVSAVAVLYLMTSLVNTNPAATDAQDNAFRIMLLLFCFTDWSQHWSVDAWRRKRRANKNNRLIRARQSLSAWVPAWVPNGIHNVALIAITYQIMAIYFIAGTSKIAGDTWRAGTAIYFPLASDRFNVWPWLNEFLYSNGVMVGLVTFFSLAIQISFPLLLLQRWTRIIGLIGIGAMHFMIGLVMGLGLFSLAMVAADVIFIRNESYQWLERKGRAVLSRARPFWSRPATTTKAPTEDTVETTEESASESSGAKLKPKPR